MNGNRLLIISLYICIFFSCEKSKGDSKETWEIAKAENTISSYRNFIKDNPQSKYLDSASLLLKLREKELFSIATSKNNLEDYESFIKTVRRGRLVDSATLKIKGIYYKQASKENTLHSYRNFLIKHGYQSGKYEDSAKAKIEFLNFQEALIVNTFARYSTFIELYPNSPFVDSVKKQRKSLLLLRHKKLRSCKTAKFIIVSNIDKKYHRGFYLYLNSSLKDVLKAAGFLLVNSDENSDVTLKVYIEGFPISKRYHGQGKLYMGERIQGNIVLYAQKSIIKRAYFKIASNPPKSFISTAEKVKTYRDPQNVQYKNLLFAKKSYEHQLANISYRYMGYPTITGLYEHNNTIGKYFVADFKSYFRKLPKKQADAFIKSLEYLLENKKCAKSSIKFLLAELTQKK